MTEGKMYWDKLVADVKGHAGAGEPGTDIVCAGVSILTHALIRSLQLSKIRGRTDMGYTEDTESGSMHIWADPQMGSMSEIKAYFRMFATGMKMLQEEYPRHVKMREI